MVRKLAGTAAAVIMTFAVLGLAACGNFSLTAYKVSAKADIDTHAATKAETDYRADNWTILCNAVIAGKAAVDEATTKPQVDTAVQTAKDAINQVLEERELQDYVLTIAANKASFSKEEEIKIDISLKNQSGEDVEIAYYFLICPYIPTATDYPAATEMPSTPHIKLFQNEEIIHIKNDLGGLFVPGQHKIKYKAAFYLGWGEADETMLEIWSNAIKITITEN